MSKLLITGSFGAENPTRASMPFHAAKGAQESGCEVAIALIGDAPILLKESVRDAVQGLGMPPLKDLFQFAVSSGIRVYI